MFPILLLMPGVFAATANAQEPELRLLLNQKDYVELQHDEQSSPRAPFVFFVAEEIPVRVQFANSSKSGVIVQSQGIAAGEAVDVRLVRLDGGSAGDIPVQFLSSDLASLSGASQQIVADWGSPILIPSKWHLTVTGAIHTPQGALSPGLYELHMSRIRLPCGHPCAIRNHGGLFRFEVRGTEKLSEQLDHLFRQAYGAIEHGREEQSQEPIARMLALHPASSAAYQLRGRRAEVMGRSQDAAADYERALQLVETGQDRLRRPVGEPGALLSFLQAKARAARARAGRE